MNDLLNHAVYQDVVVSLNKEEITAFFSATHQPIKRYFAEKLVLFHASFGLNELLHHAIML